MKDNIRLFFVALLSAQFAVAQPTPPSNQSVTATTSTGSLVSPSNFWTGNQNAIASAVGNATWTTPLSGANGGTGVSNTGKTITLGGNLTTTGAFNLGLSLAGNTAVSLPTTGTLVGSADTGTVTNTMLAGSITNSKLGNSSVTIGSTSVSLGSTSSTIAGLTLTTPILGVATATSLTAPASTDLTLAGGDSSHYTFSSSRLKVGDFASTNPNGSQEPTITVNRTLNDASGPDYAHGFADDSTWSRSGNYAYASFDSRLALTGANNIEHFAAFQSLPTLDTGFSATLNRLLGVVSYATIRSGTVNSMYDFYVPELSKTGGTVTTRHAIHVDTLSSAGANWGLWVNGNPAYFGDNVLVGTSTNITGTGGARFAGATAVSSANTGTVQTAGGIYAELRSWIAGNLRVGPSDGTATVSGSLDVVGGQTVSGNFKANSVLIDSHSNYRGLILGYDSSAQTGIIAGATGGGAGKVSIWNYNGSAWGENVNITSLAMTLSVPVVLKNYTVATLPAAASYTYGEAYVSDATQAAGTSLGSAPTGGGSVVRGVYSNGSAWLLR